MPAPALSAVVISFSLGLATSSSFQSVFPPPGFPLDVPPVLDVTGPLALSTSVYMRMERAFIWGPTPIEPSNVSVVQEKPQAVPAAPLYPSAGDPVHTFAAAWALVLRSFMILSLVDEYSCVVAANHRASAVKENTSVVGPLRLVDIVTLRGGLGADVNTVLYCKLVGDDASFDVPFPDLLGPVGVSLVACIQRQARGDVEEATVGDGVLVIETSVPLEDLPAHATTAVFIVPATDVFVEDTLNLGEPPRRVIWRIWELVLCC
ncbi:hypothetical protein HG530_003144 [Fusarium avenaceum]|nr:hypothetical protein HG530_003144 [Fusarium avenaceum]